MNSSRQLSSTDWKRLMGAFTDVANEELTTDARVVRRIRRKRQKRELGLHGNPYMQDCTESISHMLES